VIPSRATGTLTTFLLFPQDRVRSKDITRRVGPRLWFPRPGGGSGGPGEFDPSARLSVPWRASGVSRPFHAAPPHVFVPAPTGLGAGVSTVINPHSSSTFSSS